MRVSSIVFALGLAYATASTVSAQTSSQLGILHPNGFQRVPNPPVAGPNPVGRPAPSQISSQVSRTIIYPTRYGLAESSYTVAVSPQRSAPVTRAEVATPAPDARSRLSLPVTPATVNGRYPSAQ